MDDDKSIRASTKTLLRSVGYEVQTFASADEFLGSGAVDETHCLVLDVRMPGIDGLELQQILRDSGRHVPIVFVTAYEDAFLRRRAMQSGAVDMLRKPFDAGVFLAVVQRLVNRGQMPHISYEKLFKVAKASLEGQLSPGADCPCHGKNANTFIVVAAASIYLAASSVKSSATEIITRLKHMTLSELRDSTPHPENSVASHPVVAEQLMQMIERRTPDAGTGTA